MGRELRIERSHRGQLEVELSSVNAQLRQAQKRALAEQTRHRDAERNTSRLRARVHELGSVLQNPKQLQRLASVISDGLIDIYTEKTLFYSTELIIVLKTQELYRDYGRDGEPAEEHPTEALMELKRQIETVQDLNNSLVKKLKSMEEYHRNEKNLLRQVAFFLRYRIL